MKRGFIGLCAVGVLAVGSSASAGIVAFEAFLDGPSEFPPNASPGTGFAQAVYDDVAHTLALHVEFQDLVGTTTVAHIHAPTAVPFTGTAGVATTTPTFLGFPVGVTSGTYDITLDLTAASSYNPTFVTANGGTTAGAETALLSAMHTGRAYLNLHTNVFPGGEIRGFFTVVPLPPALPVGLALLGAVAIGARLRRRK